MENERVVVDAALLSALMGIHHEALLSGLFAKVLVPLAVYREVNLAHTSMSGQFRTVVVALVSDWQKNSKRNRL
jgi:hypothetical protein